MALHLHCTLSTTNYTHDRGHSSSLQVAWPAPLVFLYPPGVESHYHFHACSFSWKSFLKNCLQAPAEKIHTNLHPPSSILPLDTLGSPSTLPTCCWARTWPFCTCDCGFGCLGTASPLIWNSHFLNSKFSQLVEMNLDPNSAVWCFGFSRQFQGVSDLIGRPPVFILAVDKNGPAARCYGIQESTVSAIIYLGSGPLPPCSLFSPISMKQICIVPLWRHLFHYLPPLRHSTQDACTEEQLKVKQWSVQSSLSSCFPCFQTSKVIGQTRGHCSLLFLAVGGNLGLLQAGIMLTKFSAAGKEKGKSMLRSSGFNFPPGRTSFNPIMLCRRRGFGETILSLLLDPWRVGYLSHSGNKDYRKIMLQEPK